MKTWAKAAVVTVVVGILAFLATPMGPWGSFWAPTPEIGAPTTLQSALFGFLTAVESLVFGLGLSFFIFGFPLVTSMGAAPKGLSRAAHVSITWMLVNWWPHDSLHLHNGMNLNGLIVIDYCFHLTIIAAGLMTAYFFLKVLRARSASAAPAGRGAQGIM